MMRFLKQHAKILLFFAVIGLIGGYFVGLYAMDSYPAEIQQEILAQGIDRQMLGVVSAAQSVGYGLVLGALGIWLAQKIGLWKGETHMERKPFVSALVVGAVGGLVMILSDLLVFSRYSQVIADSYLVKPTAVFILASVTYGAVIEEVMLRLFMMSLIAYVLHKLFGKRKREIAAWILVLANVLSALLFAAGHLPATAAMMGLTPMILIRCFLLNGGIGLLLGRLYRKYGLRYAMIAHGGCHVVSKLIWILFV